MPETAVVAAEATEGAGAVEATAGVAEGAGAFEAGFEGTAALTEAGAAEAGAAGVGASEGIGAGIAENAAAGGLAGTESVGSGAFGGGIFDSKYFSGALNAAGSSVISSLLAPGVAKAAAPAAVVPVAPKAENLPPVVGMPDPVAQQQARKQALIEQMSRRGRASTILTDSRSDKLGS